MDRQYLQRIRAFPWKAWHEGRGAPRERTDQQRNSFHTPWVFLAVTCLPALGAQPSAPAPSASTTISPATQAARDADRQRILLEEQAAARQRLQDAGRQYAERLAARDEAGAQDAQRKQQRAQTDLEALARELQHTPPVSATAPQPVTQATKAVNPPAARPRPWWDVYGKGPRTGAASPATAWVQRP